MKNVKSKIWMLFLMGALAGYATERPNIILILALQQNLRVKTARIDNKGTSAQARQKGAAPPTFTVASTPETRGEGRCDGEGGRGSRKPQLGHFRGLLKRLDNSTPRSEDTRITIKPAKTRPKTPRCTNFTHEFC